MGYVDGFVLPVPKKKLAAYRSLSRKAGKIWREHGALDYKECIADDLKIKFGLPFPKAVKPRTGETIVLFAAFAAARLRRSTPGSDEKSRAMPSVWPAMARTSHSGQSVGLCQSSASSSRRRSANRWYSVAAIVAASCS